MQPDPDFALINVARMQRTILKNSKEFDLYLQYKFAKPNQSTQGNKQFQQILAKSYKKPIIMNGTKAVRKKGYVRLKSHTYPEEFKTFEDNLFALGKIHEIKIDEIKKAYLNNDNERVTFDSDKLKWMWKVRKAVIQPNFEVVFKSKMFRIAMYKQTPQVGSATQKVISLLDQTIDKTSKNQKMKEKIQAEQRFNRRMPSSKDDGKWHPEPRFWPLRFKIQKIYKLNEKYEVSMSQVYQIDNIKMYQNAKQIVLQDSKGQENDLVKMFLEYILKDSSQLEHQVEFKFTPKTILKFDDMIQDQIEKILADAAQIFLQLAMNQRSFDAKKVADFLKK